MSDEFDRASDIEILDRERAIKAARNIITITPIIPCKNTCDTGPYGKECSDYRYCVEDWEKRTGRSVI